MYTILADDILRLSDCCETFLERLNTNSMTTEQIQPAYGRHVMEVLTGPRGNETRRRTRVGPGPNFQSSLNRSGGVLVS